MTADPWGAPPPPQDDPWAAQGQQQWGAPPPPDNSGWGAQQAPTAPVTSGPGYDPPSADEMMGAPSVPSFSFDAPYVLGTELGGVITELPSAMHKRNYDTKELEYWPAQPGQAPRPKWTWPVHIQTDLNDPSIQDDDGVRAHYLEYKKLDAVKKAVRATGAEKLEVGGQLYLKCLGGGSKDRTSQYAGSKAKVYEARYLRPGSAPAPQAVPVAQAAPPVDAWQGLNGTAVAVLVGHGLQPGQVLPHIQGRQGWQGATAEQILSVVPRPQQAQPVGPPPQPAYDDQAPPF